MTSIATTSTTSISASDKAVWIQQLAQAGFPLVPILPGTRTPDGTSWQYTQPNPRLTGADFPDNYGVVLTSDYLVIDIDSKSFEGDDNPFERLKEDLGIPADVYFDTFTVRTRKYAKRQDSLHIYFKKPPDQNLAVHLREYPHIEFFSQGHYVMGPGSINYNYRNQPYEVIHGSPADIIDAPQALLDKLDRNHQPLGAALTDFMDDEATIQRYINYVMSSPVAIMHNDGDPTTFRLAAVGKDFGLSPQRTFDILAEYWNPRCLPPWDPEGLQRKVSNAYNYSRDALGNDHPAALFTQIDVSKAPTESKIIRDLRESEAECGIVWDTKVVWTEHMVRGRVRAEVRTSTIRNVKNWLRLKPKGEFDNPVYGLCRYNQFANRIEFTRHAPWHPPGTLQVEWKDSDDTQLMAYFSETLGWNPNKETVIEGLASYAADNSYHSIRDFVTSLVWDGEKRLDALFPYYAGSANDAYHKAVGRCFVLGMVSRVMRPGCKFDYVPILESAQGDGKGEFCKILGGDYYADLHLSRENEAQTIRNMSVAWVNELSEMAHRSKADVEWVKSFITRQTDIVRDVYGRRTYAAPRQSVMIGTVNPDATGAYLTDVTGNRRFWPVAAKAFKLVELARDRSQIIAEAYEYWKAGELPYIQDASTAEMAAAIQRDRTETDVWTEVVSSWLRREIAHGREYEYLSTTQIALDILHLEVRQLTAPVAKRIANVMTLLHWQSTRVYHDGKQSRGFVSPTSLTPEQIEMLTWGI